MLNRSAPRTVAVAARACSRWAASPPAAPTPPSGDTAGKLDVVAAFYPLQFVAERVGGDAVAVTNLAKPGAEPHDLELNPSQVGQINDAERDRLPQGLPAGRGRRGRAGRRRPGLRRRPRWSRCSTPPRATHEHEGTRTRSGTREEEAGGKDPHVWLDPTRLATIARQARRAAGRGRPGRAPPTTRPRAAGAAYRPGRRSTRSTPAGLRHLRSAARLVTSHTAFGYLADALRPGAGRHHRHHPGGRAVAAAAGRGRRGGPGARRHHDLLRDAGQPEGRRDDRPRGRREDRRARPDRGAAAGQHRRTTFRSCAPTWPP